MQHNVILLIFDTLRKDSIYPYNPNLNTPAIKKLVEDSVVFPNAVSPASWTPPAHGSIFTGKYPSKSGIHENLQDIADFSYLIDSYSGKTLSEVFSQNGYNTYSYSQNNLVGGDTGFSRGFHVNFYTRNEFDDKNTRLRLNYNKIINDWGTDARSVLKTLFKKRDFLDFSKKYIEMRMDRQWLKKANFADKGGIATIENIRQSKLEEPFFLFVNLMEMHDPHEYKSLKIGWQDSVFGEANELSKFRSTIFGGYEKAATDLDIIISNLLKMLKEKGYLENTIIAITSDHGQSLFEENRYYGHGNLLLDKIIEVPLILKLPETRKFSVGRGYQSTSKIYEFIPQIAMENVNYDVLTNNVCFSESYGSIEKNILKYRNKNNFQAKFDKVNSIRKAVYFDEYKLVVNLTHGQVEEFKRNGKPVQINENRNKYLEMISEIETFSWNEDLIFP
ncbi:sulfatase-like hydrolase/transferase [Oxyplasma meridianum]|uniref:Sulfatase-like hydrolase/transferase n=1 Tax=Oxyplasma meridianum TaxID=3073602 RepID=A0AAX4NFG1_9ARCH